MINTEALDKTSDFGRQAIESMQRHAIPATPQNYTVWYAYHAGQEPDLVRTIDVLIANKQAIDDDVCIDLYGRHFTSEDQSEEVLGVSGRIEKAVVQIMAAIGEAGDSAAQFGESLQTFTGKLDAKSAAFDLHEAAQAILEETRTVEARNRKLEDQLKSSSREVEELRHHLEETRREAVTDSLTGLYNRKQFDKTLRDWAARSMENGTELSLLMLDIDHFKQFNDTYGHRVGDHVLRLVSTTLKTNLKGKDVAARYGGEEFAAILPNTALGGAAALGEQLRNAVATRKLVRKSSGESLGKVTMSVGVSSYRAGEPLDDLVDRADRALYMAKRTGRNRVLTEAALDEPIAVNQ